MWCSDSVELLLQRDRAETLIEIEESLLRIYPEKLGYINEIWQCCTQTNDSDCPLLGFDLPPCSSNN